MIGRLLWLCQNRCYMHHLSWKALPLLWVLHLSKNNWLFQGPWIDFNYFPPFSKITRIHPHAAYSMLTHGISSKWSYLCRVTPSHALILIPLDNALRTELLPNLINHQWSWLCLLCVSYSAGWFGNKMFILDCREGTVVLLTCYFSSVASDSYPGTGWSIWTWHHQPTAGCQDNHPIQK